MNNFLRQGDYLNLNSMAFLRNISEKECKTYISLNDSF